MQLLLQKKKKKKAFFNPTSSIIKATLARAWRDLV